MACRAREAQAGEDRNGSIESYPTAAPFVGRLVQASADAKPDLCKR